MMQTTKRAAERAGLVTRLTALKTKEYGVKNINIVISSILKILAVLIDYVFSVKKWFHLFLKPKKLFLDLMTIFELIKIIVKVFPNAYTEIKDLQTDELKEIFENFMNTIKKIIEDS